MEKINVIILDMDGTLYQIDGKKSGYSGSSLESGVIQNAQQLVKEKEACSDEQGQRIVQEGLKDPIGLSNFLAKRYGITRTEYFQRTWGVQPDSIVQNFAAAVEVIFQLKTEGKYLILLTSAPQIWQEIVLGFIGLLNYFDEVYTGEKFGKKDEIFALLSNKFSAETVLSVGDQQKTDIEPAKKLGMKTFLVNSPDQLSEIFSLINNEEKKI